MKTRQVRVDPFAGDGETIEALYESYQQRKAAKRVKLSLLFNNNLLVPIKWYQFWKR